MKREIPRRTLLASVGAGVVAASCSGTRGQDAASPSPRPANPAATSSIPQRPLGSTGVMVSMIGLTPVLA
ncbi:MAG TPA: hypothetical protein VK550_22400 [Polyangiaceae bacterium]|nr:hypothetical protein [Polyangiaceae bacterium]